MLRLNVAEPAHKAQRACTQYQHVGMQQHHPIRHPTPSTPQTPKTLHVVHDFHESSTTNTLLITTNMFLLATTTPPCPLASLRAATTALLAAQSAGNRSFLPLSQNATYLENNSLIPLASSILSTPLDISLSRSLHDATLCATSTSLIAATAPHPCVLLTHMYLSPNGSAISHIESVVADAGDWLFDAQASLKYSAGEAWDSIPEGKEDARSVIKAAGDAYLDSWADGRVQVPYGDPCSRLEGGMYTGDCVMGEFPVEFRERRG